jgi:alkylhydroperoxidase family enzyme
MRLDTLAADTMVQSLRPAAVDVSRLGREYMPLLQLVRLLIGVVPNCDSYLAIWPPGFRTYNLLVPNLLNLPFSVWGWGPPVVPLGLALYTASRTARCAYCTAHTCAFTLRRGAPPAALAGNLSPAESAAVAAAEALAEIPCAFTREHRDELLRHFSPRDAERLALGIALMGFLNKFMDAVGVDLEEASVQEVSAILRPTGWSPGKHRVAAETSADPNLQARPGGPDTLGTKLALLRHVPAAIRLEQSWTRGVPTRWPAVGTYLTAQTGHDFPLLAKLTSSRAIRAIATVLRDNLQPSDTRLGLGVKALCGLVYATVVGNETLAQEARRLTFRTAPPMPGESLDAIARFAAEPAAESETDIAAARTSLASLAGVGREAAVALLLARAISPSPATVSAALLTEAAETLSPEAQIELVVWVSVQQMLHRLGSFLATSAVAPPPDR